MCGIIGYVGSRAAKELLLSGLERLEYRGYDSAGLCLIEDEGLDFVRAVGNLDQLKAAAGPNGSRLDDRRRPHALGDARPGLRGERPPARGLCARRARARPERDRRELRRAPGVARSPTTTRSRRRPTPRSSPTWSSATTQGDLVEAVRAAYADMEGHFAFVVIHSAHPGLLVGARLQCPLVVGSRTARPSSPRRSRPSSARPTACS